ncbi:(2Fe-2S)-binding protein [Nocardiopsis sp. RSe5-2]|uniref:(2Fe-2S)-binding protein n=1 Tax=Nocardiopsis endophytica TaxID=3018445 RepID=A0ABT4UD82_9ACTN|nr:(2Fe-2S)-binding protein [Nocardiopsis endophytica]MDA2814875.1 (2Fe-2S)-binding protein [Nocardiopsis endophytica]
MAVAAGQGQSGLDRALDEAARINAFFAVERSPAARVRPMEDLWSDGVFLSARIDAVRERLASRAGRPLGDVEPRVAASIFFQGIASRLLSPAAAAVLIGGVLPDRRALGWQADDSTLALARSGAPGVRVGPGDEAAEAMAGYVLEGMLAPLLEAVRGRVKVAPRLMWGNAASSLAGTVAALAAARPGLAGPAVRLGEALMDRPPLHGLGGPAPGGTLADAFVRRTCCLYYRIPGCGKCGDCALLER